MPPLTQALATVSLAIYVALLTALRVYERAHWTLLAYVGSLAAVSGAALFLGLGQSAAVYAVFALDIVSFAALFLYVSVAIPTLVPRWLKVLVPLLGLAVASAGTLSLTDVAVGTDVVSYELTAFVFIPIIYVASVSGYCVWVLERQSRRTPDVGQVLRMHSVALGNLLLVLGSTLKLSPWRQELPFLILALAAQGLLLVYAFAHRTLWRQERELALLTSGLLGLGLAEAYMLIDWAVGRGESGGTAGQAVLWVPWIAAAVSMVVSPRLRTAVLLGLDRLLLPRQDMETRLARLERIERERAVHSALLAGVSAGLVGDSDYVAALENAVSAIKASLAYERVEVLLLPVGVSRDTPGAELQVVATTEAEAPGSATRRLAVGAGLVGLAAVSDQPILVNDVSADPRHLPAPGRESTQSVLCVPLRLDGEVIGVLNAEGAESDTFQPNDLRTLSILADQVAATIGKARLWDRLRQRASELQRLKDFNESIVQGVQEGIVVADREGRITFANRRFEAMLGYEPGELRGRVWWSLLPVQWQRRVRRGESSSPLRFESRLMGSDGREIAVQVTSDTCSTDAQGRAQLLVFTDITERVRAEEITRTLGEAALALQSADSREDVFAMLTALAARTELHVIISLLDATQRHVAVLFYSIPERVVAIVERGLGFELEGAEFSVRSVPRMENLLKSQEPVFNRDGTSLVSLLLPPEASHLAPAISQRMSLGPVMHLPLQAGSEPMGVVTVSHPRLTPSDEPALTLFAHQLATALENVRLHAVVEQRAHRLLVLAETAHQLTITADLTTLGELIARRVGQVYQCDGVSVYVKHENRDDLELVAAHGYRDDERLDAESTAMSRHPGWVVRHKQQILSSDSRHDPRIIFLGKGPRHRSIMCVPLLVAGNRCVGALEVSSRQAYAFQSSDMKLLTTLANQVAIAVANAILVAEAEDRADQLEDVSLTGQQIASELNLQELLKRSAAEVARLFTVPAASVYLLDNEGQMEEAAHYPSGAEVFPAGTAELRWLLSRRRPLAIPDLRDADVMPDVCLKLIERGVHSVLIVPIAKPDQVIGGMLLYAREGHRAFDREAQELAGIVAGQLAVAVDNARLYEATAEAKHRTEAVVQLSFAGIITTDTDGRVVEANPAAAEILAAPEEELVGQRLDDVLGIPLWQEADGPMAEVKRTGRELHPLERTLPGRRSQAERDVMLGLAPLPDGYLISMADITRLKELDRLKTELVANVSHDLRSPLTAIKAYAELLLEGLDDKEETLRLQFLSVIDAEADRLSQCISNLLDLSRIQAEGYQLRPERFQLRSLVDDAVETVSLRFARHNITIVREGPEQETWLIADRAILHSMLKNLIDNAAKFSPDGSRVIVRSRRTAEGVAVDVQDFGPGIAEDQLEQIFEKFYRVSTSTRTGVEGSGLGLVIARQAAEAHGGDITVVSEPGEGSTFTVHLPKSVVDDSVGQRLAAPTAA